MPNHYGLPGGKLNETETIQQAVCRECKEETGLDIEPENLKLLSKVSENKKHAFFCITKFTGQPKLDFEHDDFQWVNPQNLSNYKVVPDLIEIVNAALEEFM